MTRQNFIFEIFLIVLLVVVPDVILAQGRTGSISGTVMDESAAVLPGVAVTVTHADTSFAPSFLIF